jgi:acetamidase/formamidase
MNVFLLLIFGFSFLTEIKGLSKFDTYSLMRVAAADFSVSQVVDQRQGIHVRIPKNIFPIRASKS